MKVSIITCTYNSQQYLWECIQWVIKQNLDPSNFEHIFVDGQSSDQTANIIEQYKSEYPHYNIKFIVAEPKWVYNAMNTGIKNSDWDYLIFCNSDDYLTNNILLGYIDFIDTVKADIYHAQMTRVDEHHKIISIIWIYTALRKFLFHLWFNTLVYHPTTLIKRNLFNELWYYDETKKIASDYGFRLACLSAWKKFKYYPHIVTNFRYHSGSITSNPANKQREWSENLYFRKKYLWIWWQIIQYISLIFYKFNTYK